MTRQRWQEIQLGVQTPAPGIRVVSVAGDLTSDTAPRLVRLLDTVLRDLRRDRVAAVTGPATTATAATATVAMPGHLIVDLAEVRHFGPGAVGLVRHARYSGGKTGIRLHLSGLAAHQPMLPLRVAGQLTEFSTFPTVEDAVRVLDPARRPTPTPTGASPETPHPDPETPSGG